MDIEQSSQKNSDVSFEDLLSVVWRGRFIVIAVMIVSAVLGYVYAKSLENIYQSSVLLSPSSSDSGGSLDSRIGGLASLAGISLGGGGDTDKTALALELLKSRDFFKELYNETSFLVNLYAVESWEPSTGSVVVDSSIYDASSEEWLRNVGAPFSAKPSLEEAHHKFHSSHFSVAEDPDSGLVRIYTKHVSPEITKAWLDTVVYKINTYMKRADQEQAKSYLDYLNLQLAKTEVNQMRQIFFGLIEEQTKKLMLSEVQKDYAFKVVDPAFVSMFPVSPNRKLVFLSFCFTGFVVSLLFLLGLSLREKAK